MRTLDDLTRRELKKRHPVLRKRDGFSLDDTVRRIETVCGSPLALDTLNWRGIDLDKEMQEAVGALNSEQKRAVLDYFETQLEVIKSYLGES